MGTVENPEHVEAPQNRSTWRQVAIPSEHGGWSLTLEPVLLGLLVAWSWAGLALGVAAFIAFLARTPVKAVLVDHWRHRTLDRTRPAAWIAGAEIAAIIGLTVLAALSASSPFWVPLAIAAPLIAIELWYDMRSRSRRLVPELAGAVGIGSIATAIALAGGEDTRVAAGLWCVIAARSMAAIPFVRLQIKRGKELAHHTWHSDLAQVIGFTAAVWGWVLDAVPKSAVVAIGIMVIVHTIQSRRPPPPAKVIGIQQTVLGVAVIVATAAGVKAG